MGTCISPATRVSAAMSPTRRCTEPVDQTVTGKKVAGKRRQEEGGQEPLERAELLKLAEADDLRLGDAVRREDPAERHVAPARAAHARVGPQHDVMLSLPFDPNDWNPREGEQIAHHR